MSQGCCNSSLTGTSENLTVSTVLPLTSCERPLCLCRCHRVSRWPSPRGCSTSHRSICEESRVFALRKFMFRRYLYSDSTSFSCVNLADFTNSFLCCRLNFMSQNVHSLLSKSCSCTLTPPKVTESVFY